MHSSDCQESILTKDKGHIKIEDRASFIDEIKIAFNTVRTNKMLINSAIDETEQHSGKNITHNPFLFAFKKVYWPEWWIEWRTYKKEGS